MSAASTPDSQERVFLIGVEGGGTKTVACVAAAYPDGSLEIMGRGASGPTNLQAIGIDQTLVNLRQAIHQARSEAHLSHQPVAAACLAMAGVDRSQEKLLLTEWANSHKIANRILVTNDSVGLLTAGTPEGWGIALIAGTGSIAFGQTPDGRFTRTGGWGYLLGDEGSAYSLALGGLRASVRAADGRDPENQLLPAFLERLELEQPDELLEAVYLSGRDRAWIASLADVVTSIAESGDKVALQLLDVAGEELAKLISTTARKLGLEAGPIPCCCTGGLLLNTPHLQTKIVKTLREQGIELADFVPVQEPVWGVIKLAQNLLPPTTG